MVEAGRIGFVDKENGVKDVFGAGRQGNVWRRCDAVPRSWSERG